MPSPFGNLVLVVQIQRNGGRRRNRNQHSGQFDRPLAQRLPPFGHHPSRHDDKRHPQPALRRIASDNRIFKIHIGQQERRPSLNLMGQELPKLSRCGRRDINHAKQGFRPRKFDEHTIAAPRTVSPRDVLKFRG